MTGKPSQSATIDRKPDASQAQIDRLRAAIRASADIPRQVAEAGFSYVRERLVDKALIREITGGPGSDAGDEQQRSVIQRRLEALSPYVGQSLVCVMIALPGVRYTIEIDPSDERVVHWEWQAG